MMDKGHEMAGNFRKLAKIIGPEKTAKVMRALGGQLVRVHTKKGTSFKDEYHDQREHFDKLSAKAAAAELGATERTVYAIRSRLKAADHSGELTAMVDGARKHRRPAKK